MIARMKAYIFDIDDTLYLEMDYVRSGFTAVGEALKLPAFGAKCWNLFESGVRGNTFDLAKQAFPEVTMETKALVDIYRRHKPRIQLCEDAREFLFDLRARTAIVSDGPIYSQRAKFLALGLLPWIECPIFTAETCAPKPAAAAFQLVAWTLDTPYKDCVYIADNPKKDFAGPKQLGMHTIRMRRPNSLHFHVESGNDVDEEVETFREVMQ